MKIKPDRIFKSGKASVRLPERCGFLLILFLGALSSCVSYDELVTLNEAELPINEPYDITNQLTILIQPDDALDIKVYSSVEEALTPFVEAGAGSRNNNMMNNNSASATRVLFGYRVDSEGYISFPVLGKVYVNGMTIAEARDLLTEQLREFITDVVVDVQFINFRVTVIGEVQVPGTYNMPTDRVSIFDLLGQAGDMTDYAKRKNVLVIREVQGERVYGRLNLQSENVFQSPFFYLNQNDVVYVEPLQVRTATVADPAQRWIAYASAGLSFVSLIIALTR